MEQLNNYPWEIKALSEEETSEIYKYHDGPQLGYVRAGPSGCLQFSDFMNTGPQIYNMALRPSDVFVVTFPKSGTTWTQELVWLIGNDFDYKRAAEVSLTRRFPFIEFVPLFSNPQLQQWMMESEPIRDIDVKKFNAPITEILSKMPSPRFMKSHLPISLLPPTLLDTAKVVYVARNPRDVAVSFFHHYQMFKMFGFRADFKTFWKLFLEDQVLFAPYFPHIKEAWEKRHHPNMLFLFYEELSKDLPTAVRRVAQFLEKPVTEEQVHKLCDHLHIDNFRKNKSVNLDDVKDTMMNKNQNSTFIRKGETGGWPAYFDEEMTAQAERWIEENLRGTDISFP